MKNIQVKRWLLLLAVLAPFIFTLSVVVTKGTNMPYQDDWEMVPVFQHLDAHHYKAVFTELWMQHNEHRLIVPNGISLVLAQVTHWNLGIEMVLSVFITLGILGIFAWYVRKVARSKTGMAVTLILASALLFSPNAWENWLWGWQTEWYWCMLFGIGALVLLDKRFSIPRFPKLTTNYAFALAAFLCILATFSLGSGMFFWFACLIPLVINKYGIKRIGIWLATTAVTLGIYLHHYKFLSQTSTHQSPADHLRYFTGYVGNVFAHEIDAASAIGFIVIVLSGALLYYAVRVKKLPLSNFTLPIGLMAFVLLADAVTMHSRINIFGYQGALTSRYLAISTLYVVATLLILVQLKLDKYAWYLVAIIATPFIISGYVSGMAQLESHAKYFAGIKYCIAQPNPPQSCLLNAYPDTYLGGLRLQYLKEKHYGGF